MKKKRTILSIIIVFVAILCLIFVLRVDKPRDEIVVSDWTKYSSETLGISFEYPSQYGPLSEPEGTKGIYPGPKSYGLQIGENSIISIEAIQKGWFGGEPSYSDSIVNSDYSGCDKYKYVTKNGIEGYKISSGYIDTDPCNAGIREQVIEGYFIYVFDLKRIPDSKIAFLVSSQNLIFAEKLLDTLDIIN